MSQQFLFLFVAPDKGASNYRAKCELEGAVLHIAGSSSYEDAVAAAKHFTEKGVKMIELCAGFGNKGVAMICDAVGPDVSVGAVRFDIHPVFGMKSGDSAGL